MVKEMQGAVSAGVMEMDKFSEEVKQGVKSVGEISGQLGQIIEKVKEVTAEFEKVNTVILGVSNDPMESHLAFRDKHKLPFPLLADVDATVSKQYGVYKQKNLYGKKYMGIERTTFVIDRTGRIAQIYPKVKVDGHVQDLLEFLSED